MKPTIRNPRIQSLGWEFKSQHALRPNPMNRTSFRVAEQKTNRMLVSKESTKDINIKTAIGKIWQDHLICTRSIVFSILERVPRTEQVVTRLFQNHQNIETAIKPYYNDEVCKTLSDLLSINFTTLCALLEAANYYKSASFGKANKKWNESAQEISDFLTGVKPTVPDE